MWRNSAQDWGSTAKLLHWLIVLLLAVEVPVGILMTSTYGPDFKTAAALRLHMRIEQVHHSVGFLLFGLFTLRLVWRWSQPAPEAEPGTTAAAQATARAVHATLYALLLALPLSGWAALSVLGDTPKYGHTPIWLMGADGIVPPLLPQRPLAGPFGYAFFARGHRWMLYGGGALLLLHVTAALWHHFVRHDRTLLRMWPLSAARSRAALRSRPGAGR